MSYVPSRESIERYEKAEAAGEIILPPPAPEPVVAQVAAPDPTPATAPVNRLILSSPAVGAPPPSRVIYSPSARVTSTVQPISKTSVSRTVSPVSPTTQAVQHNAPRASGVVHSTPSKVLGYEARVQPGLTSAKTAISNVNHTVTPEGGSTITRTKK